jgi:hypothetical protein
MQINPDGTKTMETGGKKMIYQWNDDLNIVTQQTEESKPICALVKVSGMIPISIASVSVSVSVSVSDESLELTQPSFKFSNTSPARLDSSVSTLGVSP